MTAEPDATSIALTALWLHCSHLADELWDLSRWAALQGEALNRCTDPDRLTLPNPEDLRVRLASIRNLVQATEARRKAVTP